MKKKEIKKMNNDQISKKVNEFKKDLLNLRFKEINNQIENPAQYSEIKKNIARLNTKLNNDKKNT